MSTYEFRTKPFEHQKEALRRSLRLPAFAFLMEMGTGKSKVAVDEMAILFMQEKIRGALIVAPKGVYGNWSKKEIPTHMPEDILSRTFVYRWDGFANKRSAERFEALCRWDGLRVMIVNIEALSSSARATKSVMKYVKSCGGKVAMYVDESTWIRNHDSNRSENCTRIGRMCSHRRIMTGFPVPRAPLDFFSQFNFLGEGLIGPSNFFAFRQRHALVEEKKFDSKTTDPRTGNEVRKERTVKIAVGYRNLDSLKEKIDKISYRVLKSECLDLPEKIYVTRSVELTDEQQELYDALTEESFAELSESATVTTTMVLTKLLRLQQILCGHVVDDDGRVIRVPSRRLDALMEVVSETDDKIIIWGRFVQDIEDVSRALAKDYGETSVVTYYGGTERREREDAVRRFQEDPSCRFFVGNPSVGGSGITLTASSTVIYYSNDFDLEKRIQSEDRAHRIGQTRRVTYVDLVAEGTVDEKILAAMTAKMNLATMVLRTDGKWSLTDLFGDKSGKSRDKWRKVIEKTKKLAEKDPNLYAPGDSLDDLAGSLGL